MVFSKTVGLIGKILAIMQNGGADPEEKQGAEEEEAEAEEEGESAEEEEDEDWK